MYERFTDRARKIMQLSEIEARQLGQKLLSDEHILLGMLMEGTGVAGYILMHLGVDLERARSFLRTWVPELPDDAVRHPELPLTASASRVIEEAMNEAKILNHNYVGTEHLLLGMARHPESCAHRVLSHFNLKLEDIHEEVLNLLGHGTR